MNVKINGKPQDLNDKTTISQLLEARKIRPEIVTVELNGKLISRQDFGTILKEGDEVEFVFYMGGGENANSRESALSR